MLFCKLHAMAIMSFKKHVEDVGEYYLDEKTMQQDVKDDHAKLRGKILEMTQEVILNNYHQKLVEDKVQVIDEDDVAEKRRRDAEALTQARGVWADTGKGRHSLTDLNVIKIVQFAYGPLTLFGTADAAKREYQEGALASIPLQVSYTMDVLLGLTNKQVEYKTSMEIYEREWKRLMKDHESQKHEERTLVKGLKILRRKKVRGAKIKKKQAMDFETYLEKWMMRAAANKDVKEDTLREMVSNLVQKAGSGKTQMFHGGTEAKTIQGVITIKMAKRIGTQVFAKRSEMMKHDMEVKNQERKEQEKKHKARMADRDDGARKARRFNAEKLNSKKAEHEVPKKPVPRRWVCSDKQATVKDDKHLCTCGTWTWMVGTRGCGHCRKAGPDFKLVEDYGTVTLKAQVTEKDRKKSKKLVRQA